MGALIRLASRKGATMLNLGNSPLQQLDTELQAVSKQVPAEGPIEYSDWNTLAPQISDLREKLESLRLQIACDQLWKE